MDVRDFTTSWRDGLAFNALVHAIRPDLIDLPRVVRMDVRERLENAFITAEQHLGVPRLIDVEGLPFVSPSHNREDNDRTRARSRERGKMEVYVTERTACITLTRGEHVMRRVQKLCSYDETNIAYLRILSSSLPRC